MKPAEPSNLTRDQRRERTRQVIVDAAWQLSRERGLTGWGLRDLGAQVGMRAPSLYVYFASKNALYDEMYAQGYRELRAVYESLRTGDLGAEAQVRTGARMFFQFAVADSARLQLLFLRVIPSFVPSATSYALASEVLAELSQSLRAAGVIDPAALDIWTAMLTGLATQQVSNDPGGSRWADVVDRTVDILLAGTRLA
ncbi:TetR/AcrR family transcriptional regulator [Terrabacter sp. NPDC080008]|uniref:TetR/AcrR family transcriptional regulator n=1 Tax=Terrabacter sp. NPDC080008 TaxID=3155176 RepID=UPI00345014BF